MENLIQKGVFYYHPQLQVASQVPTFNITNDGTILKEHVRFKLKLKTEFMDDSLVDYFQMKFPHPARDKDEDRNGIYYLLKRCNFIQKPLNKLDLALFAIDIAALKRETDHDESFVMPQQIVYHIPDAVRRYQEKVVMCKQYGLDKETN